MDLYIVEYVDEYGDKNTEGHFLDFRNAKKCKADVESWPHSKKYGITAFIIDTETDDGEYE